MDSFATADPEQGGPVPDKLTALFNDASKVRVQTLPCEIPDVGTKAVHFQAGARTRPHRHSQGQHIVVVSGVGVVGDETQVKVVRAGDVVSSPPGAWHWHGATLGSAMSHVTVEDPGLDLDVEQRDWAEVYTDDLGA